MKPNILLATCAASLMLAPIVAASKCPLQKLSLLVDKSPKSRIVKEFAVSDGQSAEGGTWQIRSTGNNLNLLISRTDFGEFGKRQTVLAFVDRVNFVIRSTAIEYQSPIYATGILKSKSRIEKDFFYCGDITYLPTDNTDPDSAAKLRIEAKELRALFFEDSALNTYLPKK